MKTSLHYPFNRVTIHLRYFLITCAASLALVSPRTARAVSEPSALTGEKKSYAYSWDQEVKEGAEADKEITDQMGLYDDPKVQAYVDEVGRRVLQASTFASPTLPEIYRNTKFTFRVLDSPVVNAFALPGGYVYVTRGLLSHVDNEAQLAVVLGHEIAHVAARHSSQQARRSQWSQLGVIAGAILGQAVLGDKMPNLAENVLTTGSQAMKVFMLRYSREAETEADDLGINYALNAGYAAGESARFFDALRRLAQKEGEGSSIPTWMSSHPDPGNRATRVQQLAMERRAAAPAQRSLGTDEFLRNIDGLIVGEDPRQGFTQNNVFYHPTLHFQMPIAAGWKVDNQPAAVVMAEPNGRAVMGLKMAGANRTHDAATQFVTQNKVQVTASGDTQINGLPATVIVGRATSEQQGQVGVWNAFIELNGKVFSVLGYAPAQVFEQMRSTFESVAGGFSRLQDPRMANVQPARLRIVRADRSAPLATFVPTSLPPKFTVETVAIMNQVTANDTVPQGAPLKLPDAVPSVSSQPVMASRDGTTVPEVPTYPSQPGTSYPQGTPGYPPQTGYPQAGSYPAGSYPPRSYPPQSGYPAGSAYPPQQPGYPTQGSSYPQTTYPQQPGYPSNPSTGYPPQSPQQGYPANTYPPQPGYPSQGYPQSTYPSQSGTYPPPGGAYPQSSTGYPQYPQSSSTGTTPNWPR